LRVSRETPRLRRRLRRAGIRIHIGLEDPQDLIADLTQGLEKMKTAA